MTMQIRVPTRQDEKMINLFLDKNLSHQEYKAINNVENEYFAKNGALLLLEDDKTLIGLIGAFEQSPNVLTINHLIINENFPNLNYDQDLFQVILNHAKRLHFDLLEINIPYISDNLNNFFKSNHFNYANTHKLQLKI